MRSHLDHWVAKLAGALMLFGGLAWVSFSIVYHYSAGLKSWDYVPFIAGGIGIVFGFAILARKLAAGATDVILPLIDRLRLGKPGTTTTVVAQTTTPPATPPK